VFNYNQNLENIVLQFDNRMSILLVLQATK